MKKTKVLQELQVNQSLPFTVFAKKRNNFTTILLRAGQTYDFKVIPPEQTWIDANLDPFTAQGRSIPLDKVAQGLLRMPEATWFSLIGSLGKKKEHHFEIGLEKLNFSPDVDNELICFANDVSGFYKNNKGSINLTITRRS